ncbi:MAG: helix-turn-helix domain-containing protein [Parvularculaceae bacterium]
MLTLDIFLRVAGATLLLVIAALTLRDARDMRPAQLGALLAISLAGVLAVDTPADVSLPIWLRYITLILSMNSAIFIWWFTRSLFEDDFKLGRLEWGVGALWFALGLFNFIPFAHREPIPYLIPAYLRTAMAVGLVSHIVYVALSGRGGDLIEARRRIRLYLSVAISFLFLIDLGSEVVFGYLNIPVAFSMAETAAFLVVILWSFFWLARLEKSVLAFDRPPSPAATEASSLTPKEQLLHGRLIAVMEGERAYLEPELSITALAERMKAPEHQLRALINKAMGSRNFRAYLNGYRMAAAKAALADPQKAALPILTIAMDSGFASLSSFNRAFKDSENETPSAFRQRALAPKTGAQN